MNFEELIYDAVDKALERSINIQRIEKLVFSRFEGRFISVDVVAVLLNVHPDTVRNYIKTGILKPEPRLTDRSPYKFDLAYILSIHPSDLKKQK